MVHGTGRIRTEHCVFSACAEQGTSARLPEVVGTADLLLVDEVIIH